MRGILAALLVATAVFLAAGCGGSSNDAADTTTAADTAVTETTTATETTASTDTTASDTDTSVAGLSEGCQKVAAMSVEFGKALSAAGAGGADADLEATAKAYEAFADQVPEEIRGSFRTLAAAFAQYATALQGVDLSSGEVPDAATIAKLAEAAKALDNESLSAANTEISAWATENCSTGP